MTCSISKGFVTYHGSLECETNYKLQMTVLNKYIYRSCQSLTVSFMSELEVIDFLLTQEADMDIENSDRKAHRPASPERIRAC